MWCEKNSMELDDEWEVDAGGMPVAMYRCVDAAT